MRVRWVCLYCDPINHSDCSNNHATDSGYLRNIESMRSSLEVNADLTRLTDTIQSALNPALPRFQRCKNDNIPPIPLQARFHFHAVTRLSEVGGQSSEVGGQSSEVGGQRSEVGTESRSHARLSRCCFTSRWRASVPASRRRRECRPHPTFDIRTPTTGNFNLNPAVRVTTKHAKSAKMILGERVAKHRIGPLVYTQWVKTSLFQKNSLRSCDAMYYFRGFRVFRSSTAFSRYVRVVSHRVGRGPRNPPPVPAVSCGQKLEVIDERIAKARGSESTRHRHRGPAAGYGDPALPDDAACWSVNSAFDVRHSAFSVQRSCCPLVHSRSAGGGLANSAERRTAWMALSSCCRKRERSR